MAKNQFLQALAEAGQSIWYDNLSRDVLETGELRTLVEAGVSGLTSNPTIFNAAISDSKSYDAELRSLVKEGLTPEEITENLMISDVGAAADLLRPIYDRTAGGDGYASIEVSPLLAADTEGTLKEARRIWSKLDRPNIMVKVPATAEGIPAVAQLLSEGINVNITLIFSVEVYKRVVEAYLEGLERRHAAGGDIRSLASVASFFVSRVDSICEREFESSLKAGKVREEDRAKVWGKVGIANSKLAYEEFGRYFKSGRFKALSATGARVQRPLWASTGTKNPAFSELLYVEGLVGRDTVNTVPPKTLKKIMEGVTVRPTLTADLEDARAVLAGLGKLGISFDSLLKELEIAGVKSFSDSFHSLLAAVRRKINSIA